MYHYEQKGPKRGIALYSYSAEFGFEKTLEDCFEELKDMGAHGIEILANTHIENYPYPTDAWVDKCVKNTKWSRWNMVIGSTVVCCRTAS